ncbi:S8 family serine peptidase [Cecembia lonarensis]|uniref:Extracellular serine proteinase n=1 Tax=Cecembia lonarensis (strain CCUG 58316 / KCTC 22772 / LW9) TaxID=1225176 RepID=K1KVS4_CECL9|nr:S8 family serine peptidase [Cecembia lonarensis]EKB48230.1 Extracellular serine proteinase precursor [Cecembia lonarensis LW9]
MSAMKYFKLKNTLPLWGVLMVLMVFSCQDLNMDDHKIQDVSIMDEISSNIVPGKYIVTLHSNHINFRKSDNYEDVQAGMRKIANDILIRYDVNPEKIDAVYGHALTGFSLTLTDNEFQLLSQDRDIKIIEPDIYILESYNQRRIPPGQNKPKEEEEEEEKEGDNPDPVDPGPTDPNPPVGSVQNNAPKYLDRIDQRALPLNGTYTYTKSGAGVTAYIPYGLISTEFTQDLGNRFSNINLTNDSTEINGSSTNSAIVIGGTTYGPAKGVNLVGIKSLESTYNGDYAETVSNIIKVYDEILAQNKKPAVVITWLLRENPGTAYFTAIKNLYNAGYPLFVSAGAWGEDACTWASSYSPYVFIVGMARIDDTKSASSNYGSCIDLFATSTDWGHDPDGYNEEWMPGFGINPNFLAPGLAAGVAAKFLEENTGASPSEVYQFLRNTSTKNVVKFSNSLHNHLLFSGLSMEGAGQIDPNRTKFYLDLAGSSSRIRGNNYQVILEWNIVRESEYLMDVYEDGVKVTTISGGNFFRTTKFFYHVSGNNLAPRTYKICLPGTNKCSNEVVIEFS